MTFCYNHGIDHPDGCPDDLVDVPDQMSLSLVSSTSITPAPARGAEDGRNGPPERSLEAGRTERDEGLRVVRDHTPETWAERFDECALRFAAMANGRREFTSEDVTEIVGQPPNHPNAVGARMNALAKRGLIVKTGYRQAERPNQHATVIATWRGA